MGAIRDIGLAAPRSITEDRRYELTFVGHLCRNLCRNPRFFWANSTKVATKASTKGGKKGFWDKHESSGCRCRAGAPPPSNCPPRLQRLSNPMTLGFEMAEP